MSTDSSRPEACPACGSDKVKVAQEKAAAAVGVNWLVICEGCQARGPIAQSEALAISAWARQDKKKMPETEDASGHKVGGGGLHYHDE